MKQLFYPGFPQNTQGLTLLILRLVMGSAFILHGSAKMAHAFDWMGSAAPVPGFLQALAAFSEFGGGIAIVLGLLTPLAALGLLCTMTCALLMVMLPAKAPFVSADPSKMAFELPLTFWAIALFLVFNGPGAYSVDALLFNRNKG